MWKGPTMRLSEKLGDQLRFLLQEEEKELPHPLLLQDRTLHPH